MPGWAYLLLILPIALFFALRASPWDMRLVIPREHFDIVSLTAFVALVASLFAGLMLGRVRQRRPSLLAMGLASLSGLFFLHGITTPGFLVASNPVIGQMGVYSVLAFGVFSMLAMGEQNSARAFSPRQYRRMWIVWTICILAVWSTGLFWQKPYQLLAVLQPVWSYLLGGLAVLLYALAAYRIIRLRQREQWPAASPLLAALLLMIAVPISQALGEVWWLSWWLYHVYMLVAFVLTMWGLVRAYQQLITFSLTGYFAAISAIFTVFSFFIARELVVTFVTPRVQPDVYALLMGPVLGVIGLMLFVLFCSLIFVVFHGDRLLREREAQVSRAHDQLQALLNAQPDGVIVLDSNGHIQQTNPIARAWLDGESAEVQPRRLLALLAQIAGDGDADVESELGRVTLQARSASFGEGETIVAFHDISRLKELSRLKTRFVSDVSHELRTPVANLKLYLTLLREGRPDRREQYLATMEYETNRLARLIEDVLDMSRLDASRSFELLAQPVLLNELVELVSGSYQPMAEARSITIEPDLATGLPSVAGDASQLQQVLVNLLGNAINYTHSGDRLYVRTSQPDAATVCLRVEDHGPGIQPEDVPHIFERFYRGSGQERIPVSGTGLGLAIVKEIVERHGGRIEVETAIGVGTTFSVYLLPHSS